MNRYQKIATIFLRLFAAYMILQGLAGAVFIAISVILISKDIMPFSHVALDIRTISCLSYLSVGIFAMLISKIAGRFIGGRLQTFLKSE